MGTGGGAGRRGSGLRGVARDLVDEPLQPEDRLAVHGDVIQHRAEAALQRERTGCQCGPWRAAVGYIRLGFMYRELNIYA